MWLELTYENLLWYVEYGDSSINCKSIGVFRRNTMKGQRVTVEILRYILPYYVIQIEESELYCRPSTEV